MTRVCKNCGTKNSFGSRYCEECGQKLEVSIDLSAFKKPVKANKNVIIAIIILTISVILFALVVGSFGSMDNTLDTYFRGIQKNIVTDYLDAFPPQTVKLLSENGRVEDIGIDELTKSIDTLYTQFYSTYGERFRIRYSVTVKEHWSKEDIATAKDKLFDLWRIPKSSVKDIITLVLQISVRGEGQEQNNNISINIVKIRSRWYIYPDYNTFFNTFN